jgi:hypothetical protein
MISKKTSAGGIEVMVLAHTNVRPSELISHAAFTCYRGKSPELGELIKIKEQLFDVSHHTTLQHWYVTFTIEGISVGDVTFGQHLASPFYNSDQRSGRFCADMFAKPDYAFFERYMQAYWPQAGDTKISEAMEYIISGFHFYQDNLPGAIILARKHLAIERPNWTEKKLDASCEKIAQEQMRMFIPVIFPTGFDHTINLSSLVALWESAWNPPMRALTDMMRDLVLEIDPRISFMFDQNRRRKDDWYMEKGEGEGFKEKPEYSLKNIILGNHYSIPNLEDMHPVDKLHFKPELMGNSDSYIRGRAHVSLATLGQDQRHRTNKRTKPNFTGFVYLPPLLAEMKLGPKLVELMQQWKSVSSGLPGTLSTILAPYGAMVTYVKSGDLNAIAHEKAKRGCFNAQEEIYHLDVLEREEVMSSYPELNSIYDPVCIRCGACGEGSRYCGRNLKYLGFPKRMV